MLTRYEENDTFKSMVNEAAARLDDKDVAPVVPESAFRCTNIGIEVRVPCVALTEAELQKKLGGGRLPRHMRSVPTMLLPSIAASVGEVSGEQLKEKVPLHPLE